MVVRLSAGFSDMAPIKYTTMPPIKAGEQMDLFQQQSLSAITSMAQASSTATEFGYPQIAQAAERVQFTFINKIYNTTVNIISRETEDELKGNGPTKHHRRAAANAIAGRTAHEDV
jgi:hypothetical protein